MITFSWGLHYFTSYCLGESLLLVKVRSRTWSR